MSDAPLDGNLVTKILTNLTIEPSEHLETIVSRERL
jgi:hypothetical protein